MKSSVEQVKTRGWVAYVGPFLFPWGQAGSRRMAGVSLSLAKAGYQVIVVSGSHGPSEQKNLNEGEKIGSIRYLGLGELPSAEMSFVEKAWQVFFKWGAKTVEWLNQQPSKPSHVIVYGGGMQYMLRLLHWCRFNNVPLIVDVVEWYDPRQFKGGRFNPLYIGSQICLRTLYPKSDGVIAISTLLESHYRKLGCKVIRVPPTLDVKACKPRAIKKHDMPLTLLYAGSPGKKDLLSNIIDAIKIFDAAGNYLRLKVIGPTSAELLKSSKFSEFPASVEILGRLDQNDIPNHINSADFTVLLREPAFFANAGFPTKVVESMANGTPVISNLTSDIGIYLKDGVNGLICDDCSIDSLLSVFTRASSLSRETISDMGKNSSLEASKSFDFRAHVDALDELLSKVRSLQ